MKKQYATVKSVWEYCDPSTTTAPPTIDDEPSDEASEGKWRKWEIKTNAQRATLKAIGEVNLKIMRTVARSKLHLITELDLDVRLRLKTLQDHFKITIMIGCEEDVKDPLTLEGLINRYCRWISTKQLHTKTLSSFAT
ncbi:hypothetical protein CC86DRAFT_372922 [Ophiobolus disseminans]|uniref:Uncharacterized protein n=1 Tax=Ophiobolus disseminans TaxID=1469910 RepID=A0A6A6ZNH5_9PLEO|nr:hypothetical protein CC86DRAFT_372922 [Ophiobolus disseminans]